MGRQSGPSPEELEFIFEQFRRGLSGREVLEELQDTNFPPRNVRFIRERRREFNAARKVLTEGGVVETGPADVGQLKSHVNGLQFMARRLRNALQLPSTSDIFSEPIRSEYRFLDRLSWRVVGEEIEEVFLPLEVDSQLEPLYRGLLEHLSTSGFSPVAEGIRQWKERCGLYLAGCYDLLARVRGEAAKKAGREAPRAYEVQPGITVWFALTVCVEVIDRPSSVEEPEYERQAVVGGLHGLHFRGSTVAIAPSEGELDRYEEMHWELRNELNWSGEAAAIVELRSELERLRDNILGELQMFCYTVPLSGYCELCKQTSDST